MTEQEALLALNAVNGLANTRIRNLVAFYGDAVSVWRERKSLLDSNCGLPRTVAQRLQCFDVDEFLADEQKLMRQHGVKVVAQGDECYPAQLAEIPDAPVVLYIKGQWNKGYDLCLEMVGSRRASAYGLHTSQKFAREFAELGMTTVSGMARGIDTAAHRGSLGAGGTTCAVLGCGLSHVYPPENQKLADQIAASGALISEFSMDVAPVSFNFPRRNRIISGLSLGVIVVEATGRSGALITSRFALEQGREVFAVPGPIGSPNTVGVHALIKQGAKLATCCEDILEELSLPIRTVLEENDVQANSLQESVSPEKSLTDEEQEVYSFVSSRPVYIDCIVQKFGQKIVNIISVLLNLELKHCVKKLPGQYYIRV